MSRVKNLERVEISTKDSDIAKIIHSKISPNRQLYIQKLSEQNENHNDRYSIVNTNENLIKKLKDIGLVTNKSITVLFPNLDDYLLNAFIRGYFDANGSVFYNTVNNHTYINVKITCGSYDFALELYTILLQQDFNVKFSKDKRHSAWYISIPSHYETLRFADWIYKDSTIHMNRKYKRFYDEIV